MRLCSSSNPIPKQVTSLINPIDLNILIGTKPHNKLIPHFLSSSSTSFMIISHLILNNLCIKKRFTTGYFISYLFYMILEMDDKSELLRIEHTKSKVWI